MSGDDTKGGGLAVADPDVVLDVDLDEDVACCQSDCSAPAVWLAILRHTHPGGPCGPAPYCGPHRVRNELVRLSWEFVGDVVGCKAHKLSVDIMWRPL